MGHPSSVDVGCNATKEFRDTYKIDDTDIRNLIKNIPEEVEIPKSIPLIGGDKVKVKENVKSLLDGIKDNPLQPTLIIRFTVQGNCDNFDTTTIEVASHRITGCKSGSVTVAGVGIEITLDVDISPEQMIVEACKCANGNDGERQKRTFHITWVLNLSINPGVGGTFDVADYDVAVYSCCCENFDDDDDDDGDEEENEGNGQNGEGGGKEENPDRELLDPSRNISVVYRETLAMMPPVSGALVSMLDDKQKKKKEDEEKKEEEEKKKKFDAEKKRKQEEKDARKNKNKKKKTKQDEKEQGGEEHKTNKSKSKKDKHQKGQKHKHRAQWEKKRKRRHWTPFGKGKKKKTQQPPKRPQEPPKPPEKPPSGEAPKGSPGGANKPGS